MRTIPLRSIGLQLLSVIAVYSFAWAGELLFMAGQFFGVFFDIFVIIGFVVLFFSCLSYCFMLMAQGKQKLARNLMLSILFLLVVNLSWVMPQVEAALVSTQNLVASTTSAGIFAR